MKSKLNLIALMGQTGAGKDTAGQMLLEMGNGSAMAFASRLKEIIAEMFGVDEYHLYDQKGKEEPLEGFPMLACPTCSSFEVDLIKNDGRDYAACKLCGAAGERRVFATFWTGRKIAQFIGTEAFRRVRADVWTKYRLDRARAALAEKKIDFVVITDCRFPNEATAVLEAGGVVWRIKRPATDTRAANTGIKGHASETAQADFPDDKCSAIIMNDGTLDNLRGKLRAQFERFKEVRR
jgi:hypothetical protein